MCCFSREVESVADTNIFARGVAKGRQLLVYDMTISANEELAMILPLLVPKKSPENALRFINLEEYPEFFADMRSGFPEPPRPESRHKSDVPPPNAAPDTLEVVEVGSFEASFVPAIKDFSRLDERFRLPNAVWAQLPTYKDYGFAVFKLKKQEGPQKVHPMAFEFPRAFPARLFFPTVHIHDGEVHPQANFDHALFCQLSGTEELTSTREWEESPQPARLFMNIDKSQDLVLGDGHCYRRQIRGEFENKDIII